jgi:hypothetical protein
MATRKRVITSLTDLNDQIDKGESVFFEHQDHPVDINKHPLLIVFGWMKAGKLFVYEEYVEDPNRITIEELQWLNKTVAVANSAFEFTPQDRLIWHSVISKIEKQIQK